MIGLRNSSVSCLSPFASYRPFITYTDLQQHTQIKQKNKLYIGNGRTSDCFKSATMIGPKILMGCINCDHIFDSGGVVAYFKGSQGWGGGSLN